jgi:Ca2+-binding RTX toxin-like protein
MSASWSMLPAHCTTSIACAWANTNTPPHEWRAHGRLAMATVTYYEQSFLVPFWQNVVDWNAALIAVPLGTVSGSLSGFAFENVGGTWTLGLGTNIVLGEGAPIGGTVTQIVRRSSLDASGITYADITGSFAATGVYEAYRGGGDAFFSSVFSGGDTVDILSPASLGPLAQSPLIETYGGDDVVSGSIHADTIYAGQGVDYVHGDRGHDTIYGGGAGDTLYGDGGRDDIFGGDGADTIYGGRGPIVEVGPDPDDGADEIHGGDGNDTIHGEGGDDTIYGEYGSDRLVGEMGQDDIFGGDGADYVEGGDGADWIYGGRGNDELYGDEEAPQSSVSGRDHIYGQEGNDDIFGGRGRDDIFGGDGDDYVEGGDGDDVIEGNAGVDELYGGQGTDEISGGNGRDFLYGNQDGDVLRGNGGNDEIHGGDGDDLIYGGEDDDTIFGGAGFDTAFYNRPVADYSWIEILGDDGAVVTVTDLVGDGGHDRLTGIQRLVFADDVIDL